MNKTLAMRRPQSFCDLNTEFKHLFLRKPIPLLDKVIQTSAINEFHHNIKLSVIGPGGEDLYNIGMVDGGSHACLLLQSRGVVAFAAKIPAQQFQRHEAIQQRITRLKNRTHAANTKSLK